MPSPEAFSERKSSSMMTIGKRNFIQVHSWRGASCRDARKERLRRVRPNWPRRRKGRIVHCDGARCERFARHGGRSAFAPPRAGSTRWRRPGLLPRRSGRAPAASAAAVPSAGSSRPPSRPRERASSPRLPMPTTNITAISAQQQPTQKTPWSKPMRNASRRGARPCQRALTKLNGVRHRSRQRYLSALNWNAPAPASTTAPTTQPWAVSQPTLRGAGVQQAVDRRERADRSRARRSHSRRRPSQQRAGVGPRGDDASEDAEQRQRRRQHHRRDHQQPGDCVDQRRNDERALRDAAAKRAETRLRRPSRRARGSARRGSRSTRQRRPGDGDSAATRPTRSVAGSSASGAARSRRPLRRRSDTASWSSSP